MSSFSLFRNPFVRTIMLSGLLLQIGIWVRNFSVLLYVMDKTHGDAFAVSMISVAEFVPIFLFSFIGGTFADRWRPKRTMVWCDLLSGVSIGLVLVTLLFGTWRVVFFATLVSAVLSQFSQPSGLKLFKVHVGDELMQAAMSLYQTMFALFMIIGPALGTFVYSRFGIYVSIGTMGIAFLLSAATLMFLPPDRTEAKGTRSSSLLGEMRLGIQYVRKSKVLSTMGACFGVAGLALGLIQPLGIFIVTERLGLPEQALQWFMMANGIAMLAGGGATMALSRKVSPVWLIIGASIVNGICIAALGLSTTLWISLTAQFINGLMMPAVQIGINTTMLKNTEEAFVGRVNGILNPLFMGTMVVTMSLAGWLKQLTSLVAIYEISGAMFLICVLVLWRIRNASAPREPEAEQMAS